MTTLPIRDQYVLTYHDWLAVPERDGFRHELIDGELLVTPSPSPLHQDVVLALAVALRNHLRPAGGRVFVAPTGVKLAEDCVLEPDVVVLGAERAGLVGDRVIDGAPDLVVEVLSRGGARRDLFDKREAYERHGVPEYWIVDPIAQTLLVLHAHEGSYAESGRFGMGDTVASPSLPTLQLSVQIVFER